MKGDYADRETCLNQCLAERKTWQETNEVLLEHDFPALYIRRQEDAVWIFCFLRHREYETVMERMKRFAG